MPSFASIVSELVKVLAPATVRETAMKARLGMVRWDRTSHVDDRDILARSVADALVGGKMTADVVQTMLACLEKHRATGNNKVALESDGGPTVDYLVWNLCGGDAGYEWAQETLKELDLAPFQHEAFSPLQDLVKRRQRELKRRMLGIKKGSGYAIKGGQRVRMAPDQQIRLKRQGREMARRTTHQLMMQRGSKRAAAMLGRRRPRKLSAHAAKMYRKNTFTEEYVCRAIDVACEGRMDDAIRLLLRDPAQASDPIWRAADEVFEGFRQHTTATHEQGVGSGSTDLTELFFDVEVIGGTFIMAYSDPLLAPALVMSHLEQFGEAATIVKAGEPISDAETTLYHIFALKPSEQTLKRHNEAVTTANVSGYTDPVIQKPKIISPDDLDTTEFPDDKAQYRKGGKKSQQPRNALIVSPPPVNRKR